MVLVVVIVVGFGLCGHRVGHFSGQVGLYFDITLGHHSLTVLVNFSHFTNWILEVTKGQ